MWNSGGRRRHERWTVRRESFTRLIPVFREYQLRAQVWQRIRQFCADNEVDFADVLKIILTTENISTRSMRKQCFVFVWIYPDRLANLATKNCAKRPHTAISTVSLNNECFSEFRSRWHPRQRRLINICLPSAWSKDLLRNRLVFTTSRGDCNRAIKINNITKH